MDERFKLKISYDGTDFVGWQRYENLATIEGTLSPILEKIFNQPLKLEAASRTDTGVHAEGQIVCFSFKNRDFPPAKLKLSLNQMLPKSIRILDASYCPLTFHPSTDAIKKQYTYRISTGPYQNPFDRLYSWHVAAPINIEAIHEAIPHFLGEKDFATFVNQSCDFPTDTIRSLFNITLEPEGPNQYLFTVCGDRFMYKMVRNIIGTLVQVGKGAIKPEDIPATIEKKNRASAGPTAPACGLFLKEVIYPLGELVS